MSNAAYEKLHKLVAHLVKHGIMSKAKIAGVLGLSLIDFLEEFKDEVEAVGEEFDVNTGTSDWLFEPE